MFKQQIVNQSSSPPASSWQEESPILDWISTWQPVREDIIHLMQSYAETGSGHDLSSFSPMVDEIDTVMRLLRYRVEWLQNHLNQAVG